MPIRVNLDRVLLERRMSLTELADRVGVTIANLSPAYAQELGIGLPEAGVVVVEIQGGAPAARLGFLRPGDLIEAVGGKPVNTVAQAVELANAGATARRARYSGKLNGEITPTTPSGT